MFSNSVDAGFVLVLPFHHGGLEPDCVGVSTRGGGGYLLDTTVCMIQIHVSHIAEYQRRSDIKKSNLGAAC